MDEHKPRQLHKRDCKPDAGSLTNGFYIRNASESIGSVNLNPGVVIAELDRAKLEFVPLNDFITSKVKERLFRVTSVGGKVVLLDEVYRP